MKLEWMARYTNWFNIAINGYEWVSKDRNRSGGGIGFFVRNTINYRLRSDLNDADIEILIEIIKNKVKPFLITTWYRPPNDPHAYVYTNLNIA